MAEDYLKIVEHYESCLEKHGDSHLGVDWPRQQDVAKRFQMMTDLFKNDPANSISLLDFGCGLSHLVEYLKQQELTRVVYNGLDLSQKFIEQSRAKYPQHRYYCLDILTEAERLPQFDYVVMNGVFTQKRDLSFEAMFSFFQKIVEAVFAKATKGIAFNVMSEQVDWKRDGSFHLPFDLLADFLTKKLSRNFAFRHDYGLYEYTTYVYQPKR